MPRRPVFEGLAWLALRFRPRTHTVCATVPGFAMGARRVGGRLLTINRAGPAGPVVCPFVPPNNDEEELSKSLLSSRRRNRQDGPAGPARFELRSTRRYEGFGRYRKISTRRYRRNAEEYV